jgi:hypothetical protein
MGKGGGFKRDEVYGGERLEVYRGKRWGGRGVITLE